MDLGFRRSRHDRWVFGICGGIAHQFGFNPTLVRFMTIVGALIVPWVSPFIVLVLYLALGLLLPESDTY